jgi:hypothetical protein
LPATGVFRVVLGPLLGHAIPSAIEFFNLPTEENIANCFLNRMHKLKLQHSNIFNLKLLSSIIIFYHEAKRNSSMTGWFKISKNHQYHNIIKPIDGTAAIYPQFIALK